MLTHDGLYPVRTPYITVAMMTADWRIVTSTNSTESTHHWVYGLPLRPPAVVSASDALHDGRVDQQFRCRDPFSV